MHPAEAYDELPEKWEACISIKPSPLVFPANILNGQRIAELEARIGELEACLDKQDETFNRNCELNELLCLALKYWYSDHPNDTSEAHAAYERIKAAVKFKGESDDSFNQRIHGTA